MLVLLSFLLFSSSFHLGTTKDVCVPRLPLFVSFPDKKDTVFERGTIADLHTAALNLRAPLIFPLLFGNLISRFDWSADREYRIEKTKVGSVTFRVNEKKHKRVQLTVLRQEGHLFPISLRGMKIRVSLRLSGKTSSIVVILKGPQVRNRKLRSRILTFKKALAKDILANIRIILGFGVCSRSIPSIRGICNNIRYPTRGITNSEQQHFSKTGPAMTLSSEMPNPRYISNVLAAQKTTDVAPNKVNYLLVIFGQFLDHDITLTPTKRTKQGEAHIAIPNSQKMMSFSRSDFLPFNPAECCSIGYDSDSNIYFNGITSFIDASVVYGSDYVRSYALRTFNDGKLKVREVGDDEHYLPHNTRSYLPYIVENEGVENDESFYAGGDVRANENPVLMAFHTLFVLEHNRICDLLKEEVKTKGRGKRAKGRSDEWYYQQARRIVAAELQSIVYNEFLPLVLGEKALSPYKGYNSDVDPSISTFFSTVAFRFGHSALLNVIQTRSTSGEIKDFELKDIFFKPSVFEEQGLDEWLLGAMNLGASAIDLEISDSIRNFLFHDPKKNEITDLFSFNIQRGRDHGLMTYAAIRNQLGMESEKFGSKDIPKGVFEKIKQVYDGAYGLDPIVGGLAEKPVEGGIVGPLFFKLLKDQFERLRDGDRFYYECVEWGYYLSGLDVVKKIRNHQWKLADIIKENTKLTDNDLGVGRSAMQTV